MPTEDYERRIPPKPDWRRTSQRISNADKIETERLKSNKQNQILNLMFKLD
jgi:hypothetical protein